MDKLSPIGVFDSGVGGVSVLRDMTRLLPRERFIYYGDCKNAPYGTKDEETIRALALAAADRLLELDIKALVIACNTATSAAAQALRDKLTIHVVGMEPALKPASQLWHGGRILVLATPATLRQRKFQRLNELYGEHAEICPCAGLMEFVEAGDTGSDALISYLEDVLRPWLSRQLDAVVLGCTHYVFLKEAIARVVPGVPLIDGNDGTARRLKSLLEADGMTADSGQGGVTFMTSGDPDRMLPLMRRLLHTPAGA